MYEASRYCSDVVLRAERRLAQNVSVKDPATFVQALIGLGYKPSPVEFSDGIPMVSADIDDWTTAFALGGCENGRNCKYLVIGSSFSDLSNPPLDWVNQINDGLDMVKVVLNDDKTVGVRMAVPMGPDGVPLTTFRLALGQWRTSISSIAQSAIERKLVKE